MTKREILVKEWLTDKWVPALRGVLQQHGDPAKWKEWRGNHCRQAAQIGAWVLYRLLPEYEWRTFEGDFEDVVYGRPVKYDHAWTFGIPLRGQLPLFVDLGRVHHELVFRHTVDNAYPTDGDYRNMRRLSFTELYWLAALLDYEYYTGLRGKAVAALAGRAAGLAAFEATLMEEETAHGEIRV